MTPSPWTDVAHVSPRKVILGAVLYAVMGVFVLIFWSLVDYRPFPMLDPDNHVLRPIILCTGCAVILVAIGRLCSLRQGAYFFRAGREGIWYKQPHAGLGFLPSQEARFSWDEVTSWRPVSVRINGIPVVSTITFEIFDTRKQDLAKHGILTHAYGEAAEDIVAGIKVASR